MNGSKAIVADAYQQLGSPTKPAQLDPDVVAAITAQAKRLGVSRAWVVRYALTEYAVRLMEKQS
jgi:hypothetical protein